jgi:homoprotocatechuate degradation regulator HpaR
MALMRAREAVMRHFRPSLHAHGLTEQQWRVLRALDFGGEMDATRLARQTVLLAPSLTRILRDLEARRFVNRRADPNDGRAALVSLAPAGTDMLRNVSQDSVRIYAGIEKRLGHEELERVMAMLRDLEAKLSEPE